MNYDGTVKLKDSILRELERELAVKKGSLDGSQRLKDFRTWDSLAVVMIISMLDKKYHIRVTPIEIASAETIQDLIDVASAKLR